MKREGREGGGNTKSKEKEVKGENRMRKREKGGRGIW